MIQIYEKEVNKIPEFNLLHDISNLPKRAKHLNINYSPIIHGCMNTRKVERGLRTSEFYWTLDVIPRL